jgi:hypothetical protein
MHIDEAEQRSPGRGRKEKEMMYMKKKELMPYDMVRTFNKLVDGLWPENGETPDFKWAPPVDVCETGDSILFKVELPGISRRSWKRRRRVIPGTEESSDMAPLCAVSAFRET